MAKRPALGSNPLDDLIPTTSARRTTAREPARPRRAARPNRAQLNVQFTSWEWVDWLKAAAHVLGAEQEIEQRDIVAAALEMYRSKSLTLKQRQAIEAQALHEKRKREKRDRA
jgi:hypothetical protein